MIDEIMGACHEALQSFFAQADKAVDSFLDGLSPQDYRFYARFGVIAAMEEVLKSKNMED